MDNPRKLAASKHDQIKHIGFNYKGKILTKTLSKVIFKNPRNEGILNKLDTLFYELIESVKRIKTTFNFYVDKDNRNLN